MILDRNASALAKVYVEEAGSETVAARVERAEAVVTVRVVAERLRLAPC